MAATTLGLEDLVAAMPFAAAVLNRAGHVVVSNAAWSDFEPGLSRVFPEPSQVDDVVVDLSSPLSENAASQPPEFRPDPVLALIDHRPTPADALREVIAGRSPAAVQQFILPAGDAGAVGDVSERFVEVRLSVIGDDSEFVLANCQEIAAADGANDSWDLIDRHPLTGLAGRRLFVELLGHAMTMSERHRYRPAALVIGLDGMDDMEAEFGFGVRDELVVAIASRLQAGLRPGDVVAQIADERFVVMLPDIDAAYLAESVAARLAGDVSRPLRVRSTSVQINLEIGVAIADSTKDPNAILAAAEAAREQAADSPTRLVTAHGFGFNDGESAQPTAALAQGSRNIDVADIRDEALISYFQPVFDLTDNRVVAGEALMRWRHPHYGVLSAGEFLGLAVNAGLLATLTDQALVTATETWADIRDQLGDTPPRLFLNLSPEQLLSRVAVDRLYHLLIATGLPPGEVVVEVTEEAMSTRFDEMLDVLHEIRSQGLRVALDDFGSGYSSLGRLRHLPVDVLKVDQSLVRGLENDRRARQVLGAVSNIASELHLQCIVEGIETAGEAAIVADLGFRFVQGYHFARPMPADEFAVVSTA